MTSRHTLVLQRFQGTYSQEIYFYSSRARIKVQEENARPWQRITDYIGDLKDIIF